MIFYRNHLKMFEELVSRLNSLGLGKARYWKKILNFLLYNVARLPKGTAVWIATLSQFIQTQNVRYEPRLVRFCGGVREVQSSFVLKSVFPAYKTGYESDCWKALYFHLSIKKAWPLLEGVVICCIVWLVWSARKFESLGRQAPSRAPSFRALLALIKWLLRKLVGSFLNLLVRKLANEPADSLHGRR